MRFFVIITDQYHLLLCLRVNLSGCQWSMRETASMHYLSFNEILFFLERHQVNIILSKFYLKWKCLFWVQTCDKSNCCISFHVISINVTHILLLLKSHLDLSSLMCYSPEVFPEENITGPRFQNLLFFCMIVQDNYIPQIDLWYFWFLF